MSERLLILIKHSLPELDPVRPACTWSLSAEGRRRCEPLAQALRPYQPALLVASEELKALETAQILAEQLALPQFVEAGLHEHDRRTVPFLTPEVFRESVAACLARPTELLLGSETANQARERFSAAVERVLARFAQKNIALVAHGTVISLFVAQRTQLDAYALWDRLGLPSFVVLNLSTDTLVHVSDSIV